jgi:caffeoyl-CoA O-methyltransferase
MSDPSDERLRERLGGYVRDLFAPEDDVLRALRADAERAGFPEIYISPELGRLLQVLLVAIGARRVLEIGTLGGYSAIWMARALPEGGELVTLEVDPERATFARRFADRAGLGDVIRVREGEAAAILEAGGAGLEPGTFDAVFIDADKEGYVGYLDAALELVRPGGLILGDNAFRDGRVLEDDPDEATRGMQAFNRRLAADDRVVATVVPIRDGLAVGVRRRDG